jgi:uncharacterized protein YkwD
VSRRTTEQKIGSAVLTLAKIAVVFFAIIGAASIFQPGLLSSFGFAAGAGSAIPAVNSTGSKAPPAENGTPTPTPESGDIIQEGYNLNETERAFLQLLNEERQERNLGTVSQRDVLTEMGREHSENMARYDYLGHEEPDGTTIEGRYRNRGLLPECKLSAGEGEHYPGAENAAHFWVDSTVKTSSGDLYVDSEQDLARGLFRGWMSSPGHRRAMLVESADQAGLGVHIDEKGKVYASLELC